MKLKKQNGDNVFIYDAGPRSDELYSDLGNVSDQTIKAGFI